MEIEFPIEFFVSGTPVSLQAKRPESRQEWKERVRAASTAVIPQPHFASGALEGDKPVLYVRVSNDPFEGLV